MTSTDIASPERPLAAAEAVPLCLDTRSGACLAWYHGAAPVPAMAVLVCGPVGHEAVTAYPTVVRIAEGLAAAGISVLRFDYPGTGDACGSDEDPGRLDAWRAGVDAALVQLRRLAGTAPLGLLGIRLGGTLACEAAARHGGVAALALWAAPAGGREFVRELRLAGRAHASGKLHVAGTPYSTETLRDLNALQACPPGASPAPRALVMARDDLVRSDALLHRLRHAGAVVEQRVVSGYAGLLRGDAMSALAQPALDALADWFLGTAARPAGLAAGASPVERPVLLPPTWLDGGVRETLVRFGPASLCGVLSAPEQGAVPGTGVVLVSVGNNYRVGPHRMAVAAARALAADGCCALRFDLAGFGDSAQAAPSAPKLYDPASTADLQAAIDLLVQQGCRQVLLVGLCSGAYLAFQTALRDQRVDGLVLVNVHLLRWTGRRAGDGWERARELHVRTLRSYRERLDKRVTWQRLARGEFTGRWILQRIEALAVERWRQVASWFPGTKAPTVAAQVRSLCAAGTRVLVLVGETDDARGYVEYQFGRAGARMRGCPHFEMRDVQGGHTFEGPGEAAALVARLRAFVAAEPVPRNRSMPQELQGLAAVRRRIVARFSTTNSAAR